MKKLFIFTLLLLIGVVAASPYVVGTLVEKNYNQMLAQLNKIYDGKVKFTGTYNRGYLDSSAKTEIAVINKPFTVSLSHAIEHGPVIMQGFMPKKLNLAMVNTVVDGAYNDVLKSLYGDKEAYKIVTEVTFAGDVLTTITNGALTMPISDGQLTWDGANINLVYTKDAMKFTGDAVMPRLNYTETDADLTKSVNIVNIKLSFGNEANSISQFMNVNVDDVTVMTGQELIFTAQKLSFIGNQKEVNSKTSLDLKYTFNMLKILADQYGPFNLALKLKNFDAAVLAQMSQEVPVGPNPNISQEQLLKLLADRLTLDIDLKLDTPKGKVDAVADLKVGGKDLTSLDQQMLFNTSDFKADIKINQAIVYAIMAQYVENRIHAEEVAFVATTTDPTALNPYTLDKITMQAIVQAWVISLLDDLKEQTLILETDTDFTTNIKLEKGIFTINDKPRTMADWEKLKPVFDVTVMVKNNIAPPLPTPPADTAIDPSEPPPPAGEQPIDTAPVDTTEVQTPDPAAPELAPIPDATGE